MLALYGKLRDRPVSGLAWRLRTWRRSGRCISVFAMEGTCMFTTKPESGEKITKLGGGAGDAKTPFTERPATYASKSPGPSASKTVPSIIGEDLTIRGNVTSKGEIQIDGEIEGDIRCSSLLLGDKSKVTGGVAAEDVIVRGHIAIPRVHRAWRLPPRRNSEGLSKGFCVVPLRCLPAARARFPAG